MPPETKGPSAGGVAAAIGGTGATLMGRVAGAAIVPVNVQEVVITGEIPLSDAISFLNSSIQALRETIVEVDRVNETRFKTLKAELTNISGKIDTRSGELKTVIGQLMSKIEEKPSSGDLKSVSGDLKSVKEGMDIILEHIKPKAM